MLTIHSYASGSSGNVHTIDNGQDILMLDCGVPWDWLCRRMQRYPVGALISHGHQDHCCGVRRAAGMGIDIYASKKTIPSLDISGHRIHEIEAGRQFYVGQYTVVPFETVHDCEGSLGFLVASGDDRLIYATDTAFIKPQFRGLTHLMIEVNYIQEILDENVNKGLIDQALKIRVMQSHMSLETLKEFLRFTNLSHVIEIRLMHLSNANSDEARIKREVQELTGKVVIVC